MTTLSTISVNVTGSEPKITYTPTKTTKDKLKSGQSIAIRPPTGEPLHVNADQLKGQIKAAFGDTSEITQIVTRVLFEPSREEADSKAEKEIAQDKLNAAFHIGRKMQLLQKKAAELGKKLSPEPASIEKLKKANMEELDSYIEGQTELVEINSELHALAKETSMLGEKAFPLNTIENQIAALNERKSENFLYFALTSKQIRQYTNLLTKKGVKLDDPALLSLKKVVDDLTKANEMLSHAKMGEGLSKTLDEISSKLKAVEDALRKTEPDQAIKAIRGSDAQWISIILQNLKNRLSALTPHQVSVSTSNELQFTEPKSPLRTEKSTVLTVEILKNREATINPTRRLSTVMPGSQLVVSSELQKLIEDRAAGSTLEKTFAEKVIKAWSENGVSDEEIQNTLKALDQIKAFTTNLKKESVLPIPVDLDHLAETIQRAKNADNLFAEYNDRLATAINNLENETVKTALVEHVQATLTPRLDLIEQFRLSDQALDTFQTQELLRKNIENLSTTTITRPDLYKTMVTHHDRSLKKLEEHLETIPQEEESNKATTFLQQLKGKLLKAEKRLDGEKKQSVSDSGPTRSREPEQKQTSSSDSGPKKTKGS